MTTLIVTNDAMYADGQTQKGNHIVTSEAKKVFVHNGYLVGVCGDVVDMEIVAKAYIDGGKIKKSMACDGVAIIMNKDSMRAISFDANDQLIATNQSPDTYGSGGAYAMAAMDFGKSPEEAIKYAATRDTGTGSNVFKVTLSEIEND